VVREAQRQDAANPADKKPGLETVLPQSPALRTIKEVFFPVRRLKNYSVKNDDISKEQFSLPGGSP